MQLLFLTLLGVWQPGPRLPADVPALLTRADLRQHNGRASNVHLVNGAAVSAYMLNRHLRRQNSLSNEQQTQNREAARTEKDAEKLARLLGYASAAERQAISQLFRQELDLLQQEDPDFFKQPTADQLDAYQVISTCNRETGRIEVARLRPSWALLE